MINVSENKVLTIAGGKWTTYRTMAEETVNRAIQEYNLNHTSKYNTKHLSMFDSE